MENVLLIAEQDEETLLWRLAVKLNDPLKILMTNRKKPHL